jgi:hypothetical protein
MECLIEFRVNEVSRSYALRGGWGNGSGEPEQALRLASQGIIIIALHIRVAP